MAGKQRPQGGAMAGAPSAGTRAAPRPLPRRLMAPGAGVAMPAAPAASTVDFFAAATSGGSPTVPVSPGRVARGRKIGVR